MSLPSGTRLGPYEVLSPLGGGGMGEVYKARDTRLDRTVAIKVLPQTLASDPQFRERFDHEARTISQLDHPHICALYDVGDQEGTSFLVMQYLEGETLEQRLKRGFLPLDQALQYGIQIADALDTAHRAGIIHRDLKPGNVMLTKAGATLLDFGLAKIRVGVEPELSILPTAAAFTVPGTILGTIQYMAPEQLEGKDADARTDIFAFGAVLFEMLTGRRAFEGQSSASIIAAILERDPPSVTALQPLAPSNLDRVVKKCLRKPPDDRWQTARDLWDELRWIASDPSRMGSSSIAPVAPHEHARGGTRRLRAVAWAIAATAGVASLALAAYRYGSRGRVDQPSTQFSISPPDGWSLTLVPKTYQASPAPLAVSPDGLRIVFGATGPDGKDLLWIRAFDSLAARPLPGTEGAVSPFWSPDSRLLGFFANDKLKKIDIAGGPALTLCDAPVNVGGTWSQDGVIVFAQSQRALMKVPASGGMPTAATTLTAGEAAHYRPSFLPDGRHFLCNSSGGCTKLNRWAYRVRSVAPQATAADRRTGTAETGSGASATRTR